MITPQERLKQEFELNLQWSRVDVGAALALHVCQWRSSASEQHAQVRRVPRVKLVAEVAVPRVKLVAEVALSSRHPPRPFTLSSARAVAPS